MPRFSAADPILKPRRRVRVWRAVGGAFALMVIMAAALVAYELRTAHFQSRYFSDDAARITFALKPGPSDAVCYPGGGPYDVRYGYSRTGEIVASLVDAGFTIDAQARVSDRFIELVDRGLSPIYHEKDQAGMTILDRRGDTVFRARYPERAYANFDSIPPLVWKTLLFIENRHLLDADPPTRNAAVDWSRLARASLSLAGRALGRGGSVPGASTLATQLEKFRHGSGGLTAGPHDKFLQMWSASLRCYIDGRDTMAARREIVRSYINSMPLAGAAGTGEVTGLADGLSAWFGTDFDRANALLREAETASAPLDPGRHGAAYREVLELLLSVQRPSYYLLDPAGRERLRQRSAHYLNLMARAGIIPPQLRDAAATAEPELLRKSPPRAAPAFARMRGANAVRLSVSRLANLPEFYNLDRFDVTVGSTIDARAQSEVTDLFQRLEDSSFVATQGLVGYRMLDRGEPTRVDYAFVLYERTRDANVLRVQADNVDAPFNVIDGAKLELGSTAKLRTLVMYLEIMERVYDEHADTTRAQSPTPPPDDPLTLWVNAYLDANPGATRSALLAAAMERRYSASPRERFYTGDGLHKFQNFEPSQDGRVCTVREAFRDSVNLPFIRIMRDIVAFYVRRLPGYAAAIFSERQDPRRQEYLARFADKEGRQFLSTFQRKHTWKTRDDALAALMEGHSLSPARMAWAFRSALPDAGAGEFADFLVRFGSDVSVAPARIQELYERADPARTSLVDRGYLSGIHPLELWLVAYRLQHPDATRDEVMEASRETRQEVYRWLFSTRRTAAQDERIRSVQETEAFVEIHRSWRRLGYPFQSLVPSLATAIGSSADSPAQLAELAGIIVNGGVRRRAIRVEQVKLATGTPYETHLHRDPLPGERVLSADIAAVVRDAMVDVVENGTARRAFGAVMGADGTPLTIGAKTGTGNNRHRVFGKGGRVIEDRALNRTSTFVFFIEDRFYGTLTAYVAGPDADNYGFTSSLPAQILQLLGPTLSRLAAAEKR